MENNNPKKSKAFIITFILILLLLLAGYYIYSNRAKMFDAKGVFSLSKIFSPLLTSSKSGGLKTVDTGTGNNNNIVTTDQNGNKIVRAEAGEDLKKGDVLYISGFNKNNNPIVMKAIANDKKKSLVFGVAAQDAKKGEMFDVIIEGILNGVNTKRTEITLWVANNPLYLSDKIYGGMTKNTPKPPSYIVPVGSVIKVDTKDGSIRIGGLDKNTDIKSVYVGSLKAFNSQLLGYSDDALRSFWNIVYGGGISGNGNSNGSVVDANNNNNGFILNPITIPTSNSNGYGDETSSEINITAPNSVKYGETAIISWTSTSTTSCKVVGGGGGTGTSGSFTTAKLTSDKAYTITCTGTSGTISKTIYISVIDDGSSTTPIVTVTAKPAFIASGDTTTISWNSSRDVSCTVNGGTAVKGKTGSFTTPPLTNDTAFNVTCTDANGSATTTNVYVTITTTPDGKCLNGADNPPTCTTLNGACMNNANNPPLCTTTADTCLNGATNPPICTTINDICLNGATNPPDCTTLDNGTCSNGADNPPDCTTIGGVCINGATNPPLCNTKPNVCINGATNPPKCTTINGQCINGATNPDACTDLNGSCTNGATNPPLCTNSPTSCLNGATNPPNCTNLPKSCTNGANNPPLCTTTPGVCQNGATNYPACNNICLNGETNPPTCTTVNNICYNGGTNPPTCTNAPIACYNGSTNPPTCDNNNGSGANPYTYPTFTPYPFVTITANPMIVDSGTESQISWDSTNTTSCNAGAGNGTGTSGSFMTGPLTAGKSFAVTCTGANGTAGNDVFVGISNVNVFPTVSVTADSTTVNSGDTTTVSWDSTNTTSCNAGAGNGTGTSGSFTTPALTASQSFVVTCTGPNGTVENSISITVTNPTVADTSSDVVAIPNSCALIEQNPLVFTAEEQAKLDILLRRFYLISSTLRTTEDLTALDNVTEQEQNFISQIEDLTQQCYDQVTPDMMTANSWVRHGNPWYTKTSGGTFPYTDQNTGYLDYSQLNGAGTPAGYKVISGYYYGTTSDGQSCDQYNNFEGYGLNDQINNISRIYLGQYEGGDGTESNGAGFPGDSIISYATRGGNIDQAFPNKKILATGCNWKDGVILNNTERILNIW